MSKKLIRRIQKLEEQIDKQQRAQELPRDEVEQWALMFALADDADSPNPAGPGEVEITAEDWEAARAFVVYCLSQGKRPMWVYLHEWADSLDEEDDREVR